MYIHFIVIVICGILSPAESIQPACPPGPAVCWAVGDPHIRRLDGTILTISTTGPVLLLKDNAGSIEIVADLIANGASTLLQTVNIRFNYYGRTTIIGINLHSSVIMINGMSYNINTRYNHMGVSAHRIRRGVAINGDEVNINWVDDSKLYITLGNKYQGTISGMCGDYCKPSDRLV